MCLLEMNIFKSNNIPLECDFTYQDRKLKIQKIVDELAKRTPRE